MDHHVSLNFFILAAVSITMVGCSTITTGTTQPFTVLTPKAEGAKCILEDSKHAQWVIESSPMTVEVQKGDGPMIVSCSKDGHKATEITVEEGFAGMTLGNIILGGGIGVVVDAASGAAQEYPDEVHVWLEPELWDSKEAEQEWRAAKQKFDDMQEAKRQQAQSQSQEDFLSKSGNE